MDTQIVQAIWDRSGHLGDPYLGWIKRPSNTFTEARFDGKWHEQSPGQDYFFTPRRFLDARQNEYAVPSPVLYADLDNFRDSKDMLNKMWPHALWQTSEDNAQAVWFLSAAPSNSAWDTLNQRMTYFMKADKGGWHASKLLRVPGTLNYKYDPPQLGRVWSFQHEAAPYEAEALLEVLPPVHKPEDIRSPHPDLIEQSEWKAHLAKFWQQLPIWTRKDLLSERMQDRSTALVRAAHKMREAGVSREDVFHALWWVKWNKFRTDRHAPQYLWDSINF